MNLAEHFESYRQSVLHDSLEDATWYAQQRATKAPDLYPTAYDYTTFVLGDVKLAIERGNEHNYKVALGRHQQAMIALFEAMVEEELWGYKNLKAEDLMRLLDNRGPKWFKFAKQAVTIKIRLSDGNVYQMTWVPRYSEAFSVQWREREGHLVFDADELTVLRDGGLVVLGYRATNSFHDKLFGVLKAIPIADVNKGTVRDWSLPLFPEVH